MSAKLPPRIPAFSVVLSKDTARGQVWVVDENNRPVATFRVMRDAAAHCRGADEGTPDELRNRMLAEGLIGYLKEVWANPVEFALPSTDINKPPPGA